ncbi:RUN domain-containing protein 1 [Aphelenchoides fujianensis]|nr:RUN domain-containing protein 1 [Aphelenchoides fujianensis]
MMTAANDLLDDEFLDRLAEQQPKRSTNSALGVLQSDEDSACADVDRWATSSIDESSSQINHSEKVKELEDEYNRLNDSVLSLSTQFAHIQFRLQQISAAPTETRDELLKELLDFASQGCLSITDIRDEANELRRTAAADVSAAQVSEKRTRVLELIQKLRNQTEDLERFAYEQGHGGIPLCELKQRQKLVFDRLQEKIRLKIELENLSGEELQQNLDQGLNEILNPIKEKDQLVDQLHTQIHDLERFVSFLQQESTVREDEEADGETAASPRAIESAFKRAPMQRKRSLFNLIGLQSQRTFERNELKKTPLGNHYGDQRAQLELAVDKVVQVLEHRQLLTIEPGEEREELPPEELNQQLPGHSDEVIVSVVRKELAPCLRALLEHGMRSAVQTEGGHLMPAGLSLVAFGCFSQRGAHLKRQESLTESRVLTHIWDILLFYFDYKKAEEKRDAAVGSLSEAYGLDSVAGRQATSQQILMATIENIATTHDRLRRSADAKWKAFVSAALNRRRLPAWIRIVFRSEFVVARCYNSWSYVCCEDIRPLLEGLHKFTFELPVDLAIRPFDQIRNAF